MPLNRLRKFPFILNLLRVLIMNGVEFCLMLFLQLSSYFFLTPLILLMYWITLFTFWKVKIKTFSLLSLSLYIYVFEFNLKDFIRDFCIYTHKGHWSLISGNVTVCFYIRVMLASPNELERVSSIFWKFV